MRPAHPIRYLLLATQLLSLAAASSAALAHGSVTNDEDLCAIQIGYFKAHFKIYLPRTRAHDDFCEDVPATGEAVFVMEYVHSGLGDIPIDFRIIEDVTGKGRFARWEDVEDIADLDAVTVYYRPPDVVPAVFTVLHEFDEPGDYIGIVTAMPPDAERAYTAVFPFEVGFTGFGYWPLIIALAVAIQLNYWYMRGRFRRSARLRPVAAVPDA